MARMEPRESTQNFVLSGRDIANALKGRIKQHEGEISRCLDKVATFLKQRAEGDYDRLADSAAGLMHSLFQDPHILTTDTVAVKAQIERASYLTRERLDLSCILMNLEDQTFYKFNLDEAKRYGLV